MKRGDWKMCSECHNWPHLHGCPNEPEPTPVMVCSCCGYGIFEGDEYFDGIDGPVCKDCLDDMTVEEILEIFGEKLSVAQGGY